MSVLVVFAMFPTDKKESVSPYVSRVVKMISETRYSYKLNAMGTVFETDTIAEAMAMIEKAYTLLEPDCDRVYCTMTMDIRKNYSNRLEGKVKSIEDKIGEVNK